MSKESIILIGGGGHCLSVIDVIHTESIYKIKGIIDLPNKKGSHVLHYTVIGDDLDIAEISKNYKNFFITIGQIKSHVPRYKIYQLLKKLNLILPVIKSPHAYISDQSEIGEGTIIMHGAIINIGSKVGVNCIINSGALIEHESVIGNHTHISTHAVINGKCRIGDFCFIGSNTIINNNIDVADNVIIASGSKVTRSIRKQGTYWGSPLKKIG